MQKLKQEEKHPSGMKGVTLGQIPQVIMIILIIGILTGAFYIALVSFQNTQNNTSKAYTGIGYVITMMDNIASNYGTVGIMIFVGILITVVFWMVASGKFGKKSGGA